MRKRKETMQMRVRGETRHGAPRLYSTAGHRTARQDPEKQQKGNEWNDGKQIWRSRKWNECTGVYGWNGSDNDVRFLSLSLAALDRNGSSS